MAIQPVRIRDLSTAPSLTGMFFPVDSVGLGAGPAEKVAISSLPAAIVSGDDGQLQYNNGGVFGGTPRITYDDSTHVLTTRTIHTETDGLYSIGSVNAGFIGYFQTVTLGNVGSTGTLYFTSSTAPGPMTVALNNTGLEILDHNAVVRVLVEDNNGLPSPQSRLLMATESVTIGLRATDLKHAMILTRDSLPTTNDLELALYPRVTGDAYLVFDEAAESWLRSRNGAGNSTDTIGLMWGNNKFLTWHQDGNSITLQRFFNYSSTTGDVAQSEITSNWETATHASRKGRMQMAVYDVATPITAITIDAKSSDAYVGIGTTPSFKLHVLSTNSAVPLAVFKAAVSQTGDMIQVRNSSDVVTFAVEDDGKVRIPSSGSMSSATGALIFGSTGASISGGTDFVELHVASAHFLSFWRSGATRYINGGTGFYWQQSGNNMLGLGYTYAPDKPTGSTYGNCHHVVIGPSAAAGFTSNSTLDVSGAVTITQRTTVSPAWRPVAVFEPFWNTSADSTRLGAATIGVYDTTNLRVAVRFDGVSGGSATTLYGDTTISPFVRTTGSPTGFTYTGAAHTTLTASAEATDINLNLARTVQYSTGALATQRAVRIQAPTYGFVGASTLTTAVTVDISGAPVQGSNATITNQIALRVGAGVAAGVPLQINGAASQTADLLQIKDSTGTLLNNCDKDGYMFPFAMGFNLAVGAAAVVGTNLTCVIQLPCDCKLVEAQAYAKTGPTSADLIFDINYHATDDASATTIWSTQANRLKIVAAAKTGNTTTFNTSTFAKYGVMTIDIDQIGSGTAGQDITITLWFRGKEAR